MGAKDHYRVSIKLVPPTGQLRPDQNSSILVLIAGPSSQSLGIPDVWAIDPDAYGGVCFHHNSDFFSRNRFSPAPTRNRRAQQALSRDTSVMIQAQVVGLADGNYWFGGSTSLNVYKTTPRPEKFSRWGNGLNSFDQAPVNKAQLQQWRLHPLSGGITRTSPSAAYSCWQTELRRDPETQVCWAAFDPCHQGALDRP